MYYIIHSLSLLIAYLRTYIDTIDTRQYKSIYFVLCKNFLWVFFVLCCVVLKRVVTAKGNIICVCIITKRTLQYHKCLVFNYLRDFKDGGGGKTAKVLCGANPLFLKKKNFSRRLKKSEKIKTIYTCVYVGTFILYSLLYIYSYLYII